MKLAGTLEISRARVRVEESVGTLSPIEVHLYAEPLPGAGTRPPGHHIQHFLTN